ncbi:hypothetical protein Rsub_00571 [Raphidocelis subcapitata]|uniref:Uncharacterized protein n=1 Tax=Raphidocelis subcapitata TaxID=307507 RepID=A0A2V0NLB0_9CHLO|nr:hypothetical protein Rsub_00571 [Raphidocelis subcapitata]|eukprot:GBF87859.1 hypothetical protein Rsub_00571 [Raphidocelis subcapitata]
MFPLVAVPGAVFGGLQITRLSHSLAYTQALAICPHRKGTKRYKQFVEYYSWKLQKRNQRNGGVRFVGLAQELTVAWLVLRQMLRIAAALHAVVATVMR